jgi:hypothetical protein
VKNGRKNTGSLREEKRNVERRKEKRTKKKVERGKEYDPEKE